MARASGLMAAVGGWLRTILYADGADVDSTNPLPTTMQEFISAEQTFTITNGNDGSAVAASDLGAPYKFIQIRCEDCQFVPAVTGVVAWVDPAAAGTLCRVYELDDPATQWSVSPLPVAGTLAFVLTQSMGMRRIRLVLSANSTGGSTVFKIIGLGRLTA